MRRAVRLDARVVRVSVRRIVVLGGGFAGLWSALGAARRLDEIGCGPDRVAVTLVNRDGFHNIRVRNYEADLTGIRVPLDDVLGPVGVERVEGEVTGVDAAAQSIAVMTSRGPISLAYDRLVFALGSELIRPPLAGLAEHAFDVDTYEGAARLETHLASLPRRPDTPGRFTVVVVGAGLTGIETAAEMPARLRLVLEQAKRRQTFRVILADHAANVGSDMGASARPVIEEALVALGIELRMGVDVVSVDADHLTLASAEAIPTATVVWCAGMRASPITGLLPVERDGTGRIPVDQFMRVRGMANVFAAGDSAAALVDGSHGSVMSCQHGRPMGRFAGHNVVCDLFGLPMRPLSLPWYVTVLDLGSWGAVYTEGWDRHVVAQGEPAKKTKELINRHRIYPPLTRSRADILAAAAPEIQTPPTVQR